MNATEKLMERVAERLWDKGSDLYLSLSCLCRFTKGESCQRCLGIEAEAFAAFREYEQWRDKKKVTAVRNRREQREEEA